MWSRRTSEDNRSLCKVIGSCARRPYRIESVVVVVDDVDVVGKYETRFKLINKFSIISGKFRVLRREKWSINQLFLTTLTKAN